MSHFSKLWEVIEFLHFGVATNFLGLGWPVCCGVFFWTSLGLALGLGFFFGFSSALLCLILALYHLGFVRLPSAVVIPPASGGPSSRLRGYLHGL